MHSIIGPTWFNLAYTYTYKYRHVCITHRNAKRDEGRNLKKKTDSEWDYAHTKSIGYDWDNTPGFIYCEPLREKYSSKRRKQKAQVKPSSPDAGVRIP
jgi:hypothetical protein